MSVQTQAVSSPAETPDVFKGQQPTLTEYSSYRETGELPERFKPAEKADPDPAATPEKTVKAEGDEPENALEAAPDDVQEQPQNLSKKAQRRFEKLLADNKELQRKLDAAAKPTQSDSSTAQTPQQPQNFKDWFDGFDADKWVEEFSKAHPTLSYERVNAAMAVYVSDAKDHFRTVEQKNQTQRQALESTVDEARKRYEDFDEIKDTFLGKVLSDKGVPLIPLPVLGIINDSPVMADVLYTIGSDEGELDKFVKMAQKNPNQAIRYIARVESLIEEEFEKQKGEAPDNRGKAPERQRTSAPPPPSPVGGSSTRAFDVNDESLSTEDWMRKRNAQLSRK